MLSELRVTELELQAEVRRRDKAVGLRGEYVETLLAIERHRKYYRDYLKKMAILFWQNKG